MLILIGLSVFLIGCESLEDEITSNDLNSEQDPLLIDSDFSNDVTPSLSFFDPGYETFDEMVDASALIIRGRVLDERIEYVNVHITLEEAIEARMEEYEAGLITRESRDAQIAYDIENEADFAPSYRDIIFYRVEILEIFQGEYEVGDIIELAEWVVWDENGNLSLEDSIRYEVDSELILFLRSSRSLGYLVFHPHQAVYEIPEDIDLEEDTEVVFEYIEEFQQDTIELHDGTVIDISDYIPDPFEINLEILREIAEENDLLD